MVPWVTDKLTGSHLQQLLSIFHRWPYKSRLYFVLFMASMVITSPKSKQAMALSNPKEAKYQEESEHSDSEEDEFDKSLSKGFEVVQNLEK